MSMVKEAIFIYLDKNATYKIKSEMLKTMKLKFKLSDEKTLQYYDEWRSHYIKQRKL